MHILSFLLCHHSTCCLWIQSEAVAPPVKLPITQANYAHWWRLLWLCWISKANLHPSLTVFHSSIPAVSQNKAMILKFHWSTRAFCNIPVYIHIWKIIYSERQNLLAIFEWIFHVKLQSTILLSYFGVAQFWGPFKFILLFYFFLFFLQQVCLGHH